MDKDHITALAREYAEEVTNADAGDPNLSTSVSPEPQPANRTPSSYTQPVTNCPQIDRLHIAAMAMQGILSNTERLRKSVAIGSGVPFENFVAREALRYADALIAEFHK